MNSDLFSTVRDITHIPVTPANTVNEAGGAAYELAPKEQLAQYVCTGTLNQCFYTTADAQLDKVIELCEQVEPEFIAKAALYARENGHMKDMPALLLGILSKKDTKLFTICFDRIINNAKMLRNFCQVIRSGVLGRKSFGYRPKKLIQQWLQGRAPGQLLRDSVGNKPTLGDIIKMVHPKPVDSAQDAMFKFLIGKPFDKELLSSATKEYMECLEGGPVTNNMLENIDHRLLTNLELSVDDWRVLALNAGWTAQRMNINSYTKNGIFNGDLGRFTAQELAKGLSSPERIQRSRCFPYQLLNAYKNLNEEVPSVIEDALQSAMEVSTRNVPSLDVEGVAVCVDTSGSMSTPITGYRSGSTSTATCVDVAALIASVYLRANPDNCTIIPFDTEVRDVRLNPRDSVMTNSTKLAELGGGGTDVSSAVRHLNNAGHVGDLVVIVSDNESWFESERRYWGSGTSTMQEWAQYKARNPDAKLVCVDIQPYGSSQAPTQDDILNIGGFSDSVFSIISLFMNKRVSGSWTDIIERSKLMCIS